MPYNTKKIITDVTGRNPVPAYFNPDTDQYEPLFGQNGSNRVLIWGANDQPLLTQDNPGHVQLTGSIGEDTDGLPHIKQAVKNNDLIPFGEGVVISPGQSYEFGGQDVNDMISIACTIRLTGSPKYEVVLAYDAQGYNHRSVGLTVVIDNSETGRYADSGTVTNIPHAKFAFWRITNRDTEDITVDFFGERRFY